MARLDALSVHSHPITPSFSAVVFAHAVFFGRFVFQVREIAPKIAVDKVLEQRAEKGQKLREELEAARREKEKQDKIEEEVRVMIGPAWMIRPLLSLRPTPPEHHPTPADPCRQNPPAAG